MSKKGVFMKRIVKKLQSNNGFTISELLIATLILLLTSGMLVTCIQLGMKQLYKQTQESEAQMLCTMLSTAVQDELTYASNVEPKDTSTGTYISFAKAGLSNKVGFYVATETVSDTDPSTFDYVAVTDDASLSRENLGKIYLASVDAENNVTDSYGLVSTGAYNIKNSSYGSLQAGMQLTQTAGGYEVRIDVYNGTDIENPLASKDFYVGKISKDVSAKMDVDTSGDDEVFTLVFKPNGGKFEDNSTSDKTYSGVLSGTTFSLPSVSHPQGYEFDGWLSDEGEKIYTGSVTVTKSMTYTAQWKAGTNGTARFYQYASDYDPAKPGENTVASVSVAFGNIIGGQKNGVTNYWPGHPTDGMYDGVANRLYRDGYVFDGWEDMTTGQVYYFANGEHGDVWTCTRDTVFIAHYTKIYTASFYRNYDAYGNPTDLITSVQIKYNDNLTFPGAPTLANHVFTGWEYERAINDKVITNVDDTGMKYIFEKDMSFVATWDNFTLTFINGNSQIGKAIYHQSTGDYTYTDAVETGELVHTDSANWEFAGWYTNPGTSSQVQEFDEYGNPTAQNTILSKLSASNRNVDLYAGWKNKYAMYYKTDVLETGSYFLIVGGNAIGNNRKVLTDNGSNTTTANVTVRGNDTERYVVYQNALDAYDWYLDGNNYIRKMNNNNLLDINTSGKLIMKNDGWIDNARHWRYENHALVGSWGLSANRYVYFSNNSFGNSTTSTSNGNIHIYEYKDVGEILSFNGYSQ